jgi:hypothetical protein
MTTDMSMMIDEKLARLRTHRNNISRFHRLLKTELTELERRFIEKRVSEQRIEMEALAVSTFPMSFKFPLPASEADLIQPNHEHDLFVA